MIERLSSVQLFQFWKNRSLQNFVFLSLIQASNILITIISMPLLITSIGVDQFGLVSLAFSVMVITNIFVSFGFNLSGPRMVALNQGNPTRLGYLLSNIIGGKLILASVATAILLVAVFGFSLFSEYPYILAFSLLLLFSEATLPLWFFQGMEKMKLVSAANVFAKLLYLTAIVLFIHEPNQAKWVNFLLGGCGLTVNLIVLAIVRIKFRVVLFSPKIRHLVRSLRANAHYFLSNLTSYFTFNGGLIILSFFAGSATLGMYSLAEKVIMVIRMFPAILTQSVYPQAAKLHRTNDKAFHAFLKRAYIFGLSITLLAALGVWFLAPFIIHTLSKRELIDSVFYLRLLSFIPFLACLNMVNVLFLLVSDQQKRLFYISSVMCTYMVFIGSLLTYAFGVAGLCIALLSTELLHFVVFSAVLYRKKPDLWRQFYLAR